VIEGSVIENGEFDVETILTALCDWNAVVGRALRTDATTTEIVAGLRSPELRDRLQIAQAAIRRPVLDIKILEQLASDPIRDLRIIAASDESTPGDLLHQLAQDRSYEVRLRVAVHISTAKKTLVLLCSDPRDEVVLEIAHRPLPTAQIVALSQHPSTFVRVCIAEREDAPHEVLLQLTTDENDFVRWALAGRSTPDDVTEVLLRDEDDDVVCEVASREVLPEKFIRFLATHPSPSVRSLIAARNELPLEVSYQLASDESSKVLTSLASATCDEETLILLTSIPQAAVQRCVMVNPVSTLTVLEKFTHLRSDWNRQIFLQHPAVTPDLIRPFLSDPLRETRDLAREAHLRCSGTEHPLDPNSTFANAINIPMRSDPAYLYWMLDTERLTPDLLGAATDRNLPLHLRIALLSHPATPTEVVRACVSDPLVTVRAHLAALPHLALSLATTLATDRARSVRAALLNNAHCPVEVVQQLTKDPDPHLRREARNNRRYLAIQELERDPI
jgi:hypothetical protein